MARPKQTAQEKAKRRQVGKTRSIVTPGFELTQSWTSLCTDILRLHPDWPSWEICREIHRRGIKKLIPGIGDTIRRARLSLGIETSRADREGDPYIIAPVRLTREQYEKIARVGQHVGLELEKILENFIKSC